MLLKLAFKTEFIGKKAARLLGYKEQRLELIEGAYCLPLAQEHDATDPMAHAALRALASMGCVGRLVIDTKEPIVLHLGLLKLQEPPV
jgi:hypothetical protein